MFEAKATERHSLLACFFQPGAMPLLVELATQDLRSKELNAEIDKTTPRSDPMAHKRLVASADRVALRRQQLTKQLRISASPKRMTDTS